MAIADGMARIVETSSVVKEMFEEGARLKAEHGPDKVYDFSLGNPDIPPPPELKRVLRKLVQDDDLSHGYMPNAGYFHVRRAVANGLRAEQGVDMTPGLVVMTPGAAGALNVVFKALLNPAEEVLVPSPYFVGYTHCALNANAVLKAVPTRANFHLDLGAIRSAINERTRVMLINSPNNPTGVIYKAEELVELGRVLDEKSREFGKRIYLLSDEPYRKIAYDMLVPSVFDAYPHTLVVNSYSKELSLAGERIGYLAIHPGAEDAIFISEAASMANTMLYVNAPSLFQLAVAEVQGLTVDVSIYKRRRDLLCQGLREAGYKFSVPEGAFYLFPISPLPDDMAFTRILKEELILAAPGVGFGAPGYFRLSYAVPESTISGSFGGFKRAMEKV